MSGGGEAAGPDDHIRKLDLFLGDDWILGGPVSGPEGSTAPGRPAALGSAAL